MNRSSSINPYAPGEVSKQKAPSGPVEFPGQQIKLSFVYDLKYLVEAVDRFRVRKDNTIGKPIGFLGRWWVPLLCIGYALFLFATRRSVDYVASFFFLTLGALIIFKRKLENVVLRRSFKSVPHLNQRYSITLTDEGFYSKSPLHDSKVLWTAFTDAIEYSDGVLLSEGKQRYHWLPFKSLEDQNQSQILFRYVSSRLLAEDVVSQRQSLADSPQSSIVGDQIKASIAYDANFLLQALARIRKQHRVVWRTIMRYVLAAAVLGFGILMIGTEASWMAVPLLMVAAAIVFWRQLINLKLVYQFKSSPHNNDLLVITLSDNGCHAKSALQNAELTWSSFTEVAQFPDGVLLCRGKLHGVWIPFRCLENESDASRLYEFVSSRIANAKALKEGQTQQTAQLASR